MSSFLTELTVLSEDDGVCSTSASEMETDPALLQSVVVEEEASREHCDVEGCTVVAASRQALKEHWTVAHARHRVRILCPFPQCDMKMPSLTQYFKHLTRIHKRMLKVRHDVLAVYKEVPKLAELEMNPGYVATPEGEGYNEVEVPRGSTPYDCKPQAEEALRRVLAKRGLVKPAVSERPGRQLPGSPKESQKPVPVSPTTSVRKPATATADGKHTYTPVQKATTTTRAQVYSVLTSTSVKEMFVNNRQPVDATARTQLVSNLQFAAHQLYKESARVEVEALRGENEELRRDNRHLQQELSDWETGVRRHTD